MDNQDKSAYHLYIGRLIAKKFQGQLNESESDDLEHWANLSSENLDLLRTLTSMESLASDLSLYDSYQENELCERLESKLLNDSAVEGIPVLKATRKSYSIWKRWAAAAAFMVVFAGAAWWLSRTPSNMQNHDIAEEQHIQEILPGKDGALLTLADGRQVTLDTMTNGVLENKDGVEVTIANGQLLYTFQGLAQEDTPQKGELYHTISTPKGRQFQIILPDGTKVWLNAASSLRYPTVFGNDERRVDITGEAYFEVSRNARVPFHVQVNGLAQVEVLGTAFNINAYGDEASMKATLVNGSVRVKRLDNQHSASLLPGQQAVLSEKSALGGTAASNLLNGIAITNNADIEKVLAWKNGLFNFEGTTLTEMMKQLERWYDIEVVYKNNPPEIHFSGEMSKDIPLADLLEAMKKMRLNFKLEEGRRLIVSP